MARNDVAGANTTVQSIGVNQECCGFEAYVALAKHWPIDPASIKLAVSNAYRESKDHAYAVVIDELSCVRTRSFEMPIAIITIASTSACAAMISGALRVQRVVSSLGDVDHICLAAKGNKSDRASAMGLRAEAIGRLARIARIDVCHSKLRD